MATSPYSVRRLTPTVQRVVRVGSQARIDQRIAEATSTPEEGSGRTGAQQLGDLVPTDSEMASFGNKFLDLPVVGLRTQYNRLNDLGNEMVGLADFQGGTDPSGSFDGVPMFDQRTGQPIVVGAPDRVTAASAAANRSGSSTAAWGQQFQNPQRAPTIGDPQVTSFAKLDGQMEEAAFKTRQYQQAIASYQAQIDQLNQMQLAALQAGASELARQYDEQIGDLTGRLEATRVAMSRSMAAYESYAAQVGPAYQASVEAAVAGEAAREGALAGRVENVEAAISGTYDASVEDLEETATLIGTGNLALSESLGEAVSMFEGMMRSAASGRIEDVDRISEAAALFATAQAKAVKADDAFMTEVERETLEIEIQSQLDQLTDQIETLETNKKRAIDAHMSQYDPQGGFDNPEDEWAYLFQQFAMDSGWGFDEEALVKSLMGQMLNSGVGDRAEAVAWLRENEFADSRYDVLATLLGDHYEGREIPEYWIPRMLAIAAGDPLAGKYIEEIRQSIQDPDFNEEVLADLFRESEGDYSNVLDAFDMYSSHIKNWNDARTATASSGGGGEAVSNYANRNSPTYVRRRTVGVPEFAKAFQAAFGKTGTGREYIGGVTSSLQGALRDPKMTGNGRSGNSDHLSGGALDLYGATVQELEAIARWARSQPGVSFVVYEGNSAHQTGYAGGANSGVSNRGHVHVSLQVGYW